MEKTDRSLLWEGFWQLADPKIWIASTVPMAVGGALAFGLENTFNLYWFLVSMFGIFLIEIGKNAINEYIDYQSGVDLFVTPDKRTPFSGGKKAIVDGKLTLKQTAVIAVVTMLGGCLTGLYIVFFREPSVIWIGMAGVFMAVFYSLPPLKLCYRGVGELTVGFTFGPLILLGTFLVQVGTIYSEVVLASLPIGFIIANVLWINQYPDVEADERGKKYNLVVRLGKKRGLIVYVLLYAAAYFSLLVLALVSSNLFWLLPFLGIPLVVRSIRVAYRSYNHVPRLVEANAKTVQAYQLTGATMTVAAILTRLLV